MSLSARLEIQRPGVLANGNRRARDIARASKNTARNSEMRALTATSRCL
jgi:hypothetical protein